MLWRIVRNRNRIGKKFRLQFGQWFRVVSQMTERSPKKRFHVDYEEYHDTREQAEQAKREREGMKP